MSIAFRAQVTSTQKLVLLALCDSANDSGECYPSVPTLVQKCSLSDRAVQKAVLELEQLGQLRRELRTGRSTVYWMTPNDSAPPNVVHPRTQFTPERGSPTPERRSPPPPNVVHPTPERGSPITINEPSIEPSPKRQARPVAKPGVDAEVLVAAGFDLKTAQEFIEHKRAAKAPLTERAWKDHLSESAKAGWSPQEAAEKVMAKNWRGFEARYVEGQKPAGSKQDALEARNKSNLSKILENMNAV